MSEQHEKSPAKGEKISAKGKGAIVVGAGIGGIRSALDLADAGHHVTLIEKSPHMGGILSKLDYQFPTDRCGMCRMLPMIHRDSASQYCLRRGLFHENIDLMLSTTLEKIDGEAGNYTIQLRQQKKYVNPDLCTGCGECTEVCPVDSIPDAFNEGSSTHKAIYLPLPHAIPKVYTIDMHHCTLCGACVEACPENAVTLPEDQKQNFRIIVVDDELIVRDSVKEWFEFEGYSVDMAESGPVALEMISKNTGFNNESSAKGYSLMMLDIKMPGMEGTEVLKRAKEIDPELQVVMMTAYATVETAVETMKSGALEYIIKPFDPDTLIEKVNRIYQAGLESDDAIMEMDAGAVIMACGTDYYNPLNGRNTFGYKVYPDVMTSLEFERMVSGSGATGGKILRPSNGEAPRRIAWIQCVGSRDIQNGAPYCSSVCCMFALKEAVLARKRSGGSIETVIYYMDMRCFGKEFEAYKKEAQETYHVILKRIRPHSVRLDNESGKLHLFIADGSTLETFSAAKTDEVFDIVVLSVGQRPAQKVKALAELTGMPLNDFGFPESGVLPGKTDSNGSRKEKNGILIGGAFGGLKDISESVIHASAASADAMKILNVLRGIDAPIHLDHQNLLSCNVVSPLISSEVNITTRLAAFQEHDSANGSLQIIKPVAIDRKVLVIGAGIAGMTAALTIADSGYRVILVETSPEPGGNLKWLDSNLNGDDLPAFLSEMKERMVKHPLIFMYCGYEVIECRGEVGNFSSTIEKVKDIGLEGQGTLEVIQHGAVIIATGASEAETSSYAYGENSAIVTLKGLQEVLNSNQKTPSIDPMALESVVMIQCVDSRDEIKPYCSRICCTSSLKHALTLKRMKPDIQIYILYRDMMSPGFTEKYYNEARQAGILFIQYSLKEKPQVYIEKKDYKEQGQVQGQHQYQDAITVRIHEPIIDQIIDISADLLVLATGVSTAVSTADAPRKLAHIMGIHTDEYHFFKQADSKWRPVDSTREGIFLCGMAIGPRDVEESMVSAKAAAMRAMRILTHEKLHASVVTAMVKTSLCSLCLLCVDTCPYEARHLNEETMKIDVNAAMCQGCGACATVCPNSASFVSGFTDQQMFESIDAAIGY